MSMLTLSKEADYGILFISYLKDKNDYISLSQMVKKIKLPLRFLARIASKLAKNKIVSSREGKIGGYKLTKKIEKITLYDYLKIFEENLFFLKCENKKNYCSWKNYCRHRFFLKNVLQKSVIDNLKEIKLKDIF